VPVVACNWNANPTDCSNKINAGNAADLTGNTDPWDGSAHVAGHRSSHGSIFAAGPNLDPGDWVDYNGRRFKVSWEETVNHNTYSGSVYGYPLTIQYSVDATYVRLVHCVPA